MRKTLISSIVAGAAALPAFAHHEDIPASGNGMLIALSIAAAIIVAGAVAYMAVKAKKKA